MCRSGWSVSVGARPVRRRQARHGAHHVCHRCIRTARIRPRDMRRQLPSGLHLQVPSDLLVVPQRAGIRCRTDPARPNCSQAGAGCSVLIGLVAGKEADRVRDCEACADECGAPCDSPGKARCQPGSEHARDGGPESGAPRAHEELTGLVRTGLPYDPGTQRCRDGACSNEALKPGRGADGQYGKNQELGKRRHSATRTCSRRVSRTLPLLAGDAADRRPLWAPYGCPRRRSLSLCQRQVTRCVLFCVGGEDSTNIDLSVICLKAISGQ